jgi:hypothetical protein
MTNAQTLRHLLRKAGYCSIPLYGKEPPVYNDKKKNNSHGRGLGGWQLLTNVTDEMIDMWSITWPDATNTGVLTFNMPVADMDILNEEAARALEAHIRERFEERGYILVRIGRPPKRAILFRTAMGPFKTFKVSLIAPDGSEGQKIELLANGAQVVVDGIHPDTGKPYSVFGGNLTQIKREELPDIREDEAHQLVEELVEILIRDFGYTRAPSRPKANGGQAAPRDGGGGGDSDWAHLFENIRLGRELHDSITILAAKMIASGMNSGAAINQLRGLMEASTASKDERWHARVSEIPAAVDSAVAKYGRGTRSSEEPEPEPQPEPEPEEPEPEPPEEPEPEQPDPKPYTGRFAVKILENINVSTAPNYLVKSILPRVGLGVMWGPPKCGKSFKAFDLAMHIATGRTYRGHLVRQGPVVYLALEGGFGFAGRVEAWRQHHKPPKDTPFFLITEAIDLITDAQALIAAIRAQLTVDPAAVVIDTLNRSIAGSENDDKDMGKYIKAADAIRVAFGCLVLLIHHCGTAGNRPRGHTSLSGADDVQIAVDKDKDGIVRATIEFMKDGPAGAVIASELKSVTLGTDTDGDDITSCIIVPSAAGQAEAKLPKGAALALDALRKLLASSIDSIPAPEGAKLPAGSRIVRNERWREQFYNTTPQDNQAAKQKAFKRAHEDLMNAKLIDFWDVYVWVSKP